VEDDVASHRECVLTKGIADDVLGPGVVDAVDLDHDAEVGPVEGRTRTSFGSHRRRCEPHDVALDEVAPQIAVRRL